VEARPPQAKWPTDLDVPGTDYPDLVVSMDPVVQATIGREALNHIIEKGGKAARKAEKWEQEVESAKAIVVVLGNGEILRLLSIVVLRVEDGQGHLFAQVGMWDGVAIKPGCYLPNIKQERGELVGEAADRLLNERLAPLRGKLAFSGFTRETIESRDVGIHTKYEQCICSAMLIEGEKLDVARAVRKSKFEQVPVERSRSESSSHHSKDKGEVPSAPDPATQRLLDSLLSVAVFAIAIGHEAAGLYAWLPQETLHALSAPAGEAAVAMWMSSMALPTEFLEDTLSDVESEVGLRGA